MMQYQSCVLSTVEMVRDLCCNVMMGIMRMVMDVQKVVRLN